MKSECTGAPSMSTSRPQESGKPQQNGALERPEQEVQSAQVSLEGVCRACAVAVGHAQVWGLHVCQLPCAEKMLHSASLNSILEIMETNCCKRMRQRQGCLQTPGGPENGEASSDGQIGQGDQGGGAAAKQGLGGNVREASSNGGAHLAPTSNAEPVGGGIKRQYSCAALPFTAGICSSYN